MRIDNKLIWEAYTTVHNESPDHVCDNEGNSLFFWNAKSKLTSAFMRIGKQWFLSGVNILNSKTDQKGGNKSYIHSDLFSHIIETEVMKVIHQKLENFDFYEALNNDDPTDVIKFIEDLIKTSRILIDIYNQYKKHNEGDVFFDQLKSSLINATDPKIKAFRISKGYEFFNMMTIFYEPDISLTRSWFECGRLWLQPQTDSDINIPGLVISMWKPPRNRTAIQNELVAILQNKGYKFSHVSWDGDKDIDPKTKHIKASKLQVNNNPSWDDIKYAN